MTTRVRPIEWSLRAVTASAVTMIVVPIVLVVASLGMYIVGFVGLILPSVLVVAATGAALALRRNAPHVTGDGARRAISWMLATLALGIDWLVVPRLPMYTAGLLTVATMVVIRVVQRGVVCVIVPFVAACLLAALAWANSEGRLALFGNAAVLMSYAGCMAYVQTSRAAESVDENRGARRPNP